MISFQGDKYLWCSRCRRHWTDQCSCSSGKLCGDIGRFVQISTEFDGDYGPRTQIDGDSGRGPLHLIAAKLNPGRALNRSVLDNDTVTNSVQIRHRSRISEIKKLTYSSRSLADAYGLLLPTASTCHRCCCLPLLLPADLQAL